MEEKKSRLSYTTWWIGGILGAIIGLIVAGGDNVGPAVLVGVINGVFLGWIIGLLIDAGLNSKPGKELKQKVEEVKFEREAIKSTKESINQYEEAKQSFKYLSTETLRDKYDAYIEDGQSDMRQLALEEELVNRGVLEYSPMHEKIEKIKELMR